MGKLIISEYSTELEKIVNKKNLMGCSPIDLIFEQTDLEKETLDMLINGITMSLGEDELQWDCVSHIFPYKFKIGDKSFEVGFDRICNDNGIVEKALVTIKDITSFESMEQTSLENKELANLIIEITNVNSRDFISFVEQAQIYIRDARAHLSSTKSFNLESIEVVFRNMHRLKGVARTFGFISISNKIHVAEQILVESIANKKLTKESKDQILEDLNITEASIHRMSQVAKDNLNLEIDRDIAVRLPISVIQRWQRELLTEGIDSIAYQMQETYTCTFKQTISRLIPTLGSTAKQLDKPVPILSFRGDDKLFLARDRETIFQKIMIHLLRNALDHEKESPEERKRLGKPAVGIIEFSLTRSVEGIKIVFADDGAGLDLLRLREKPEANFIKEEDDLEVAKLIFSNGLSTKSEASEISGRGIGMSAVYQMLHDVGGKIEIAALGHSQNGRLRFKLEILLPIAFCENDLPALVA